MRLCPHCNRQIAPYDDQPKPTTGEWWTEQDADGYWHMSRDMWEETAKKLDKKLAAEREKVQHYKSLLQEIQDGRKP